jgi:hypothetical protein
VATRTEDLAFKGPRIPVGQNVFTRGKPVFQLRDVLIHEDVNIENQPRPPLLGGLQEGRPRVERGTLHTEVCRCVTEVKEKPDRDQEYRNAVSVGDDDALDPVHLAGVGIDKRPEFARAPARITENDTAIVQDDSGRMAFGFRTAKSS